MGSRLLTGGVLAVIGLITLKVLFAVFGAIAALVGFLFFRVLPIVLIGWILLRVVKSMKNGAEAA